MVSDAAARYNSSTVYIVLYALYRAAGFFNMFFGGGVGVSWLMYFEMRKHYITAFYTSVLGVALGYMELNPNILFFTIRGRHIFYITAL